MAEIEETNIDLPLVLVIEDNIDVNQYICGVLSGIYRTVSAYDGEDGLEKTFALHPNVILSDIMMPKIDGLQLINRIREREDFQDVPIIIISGKPDLEVSKKILAAGAQEYLTKPFSHAELKAKVASVLNNRKEE
jgi:CheY-like chemotaxis protein